MTNPFLSLWLSAANTCAGAARSFWTAEMQRQQTTMMNEMTKQMTRFWMDAWKMPVPATARKGQRSTTRS